jgi:hypothetical protein
MAAAEAAERVPSAAILGMGLLGTRIAAELLLLGAEVTMYDRGLCDQWSTLGDAQQAADAKVARVTMRAAMCILSALASAIPLRSHQPLLAARPATPLYFVATQGASGVGRVRGSRPAGARRAARPCRVRRPPARVRQRGGRGGPRRCGARVRPRLGKIRNFTIVPFVVTSPRKLSRAICRAISRSLALYSQLCSSSALLRFLLRFVCYLSCNLKQSSPCPVSAFVV